MEVAAKKMGKATWTLQYCPHGHTHEPNHLSETNIVYYWKYLLFCTELKNLKNLDQVLGHFRITSISYLVLLVIPLSHSSVSRRSGYQLQSFTVEHPGFKLLPCPLTSYVNFGTIIYQNFSLLNGKVELCNYTYLIEFSWGLSETMLYKMLNMVYSRW